MDGFPRGLTLTLKFLTLKHFVVDSLSIARMDGFLLEAYPHLDGTFDAVCT
jgi:hypothetical protein